MAGSVGTEGGSIRSPFEGRLIRLRAVEESDLEWINREFWNPAVTRFMAAYWPESQGGTRAWWKSSRSKHPGPMLIETLTGGERVGACSLEDVDERSRAAELGIWIAEALWNQGFGTDAVRTLCRFGFREINLQRISLSVHDINPRAKRAYEKVGFKEEGRRRRAEFIDGGYCDVIVMGCLAEELIEV